MTDTTKDLENNIQEEAQSKSAMMSIMVKKMGDMKKTDLTSWFNDAIALIGKEADTIPDGTAQKNAASVAMKEDIDNLFGDTLDEEYKEKATTLFEAAVSARVEIEKQKIQEESDAKLDEMLKEGLKEIEEKFQSYFNEAKEEWFEENKVAIESSLKAQVAESFIEGIKQVFAEHYVEVPDEKIDVLEGLTTEIDELKNKLNESVNEKIEAEKALKEAKQELAFKEVSEGLALTDIDRLKVLSEDVDFEDEVSYKEKVSLIKEQFFGSKQVLKKSDNGVIVEEVNEFEHEDSYAPEAKGPMANYVKAISKSLKK